MFDNVHTTHRYEISADFSYNSIRLWGGVMCTVFQNSEIGFKSLFILWKIHFQIMITFFVGKKAFFNVYSDKIKSKIKVHKKRKSSFFWRPFRNFFSAFSP